VSEGNARSAQTEAGDLARTLGLGATQGRRRGYLKWAVPAAALVVVLFAFRWFGGDESQAVQYRTTEVTRGDLTVTVSATGTLQPVNQVDVGSEVSGTIRDVAVDFNDRVKLGDVLAVLDTDQLEARVKQARASLGLAQAQVQQAEATVTETASKLRRANKLVQSRLASEEELDTAQAANDRAQAERARSRAQVVQAQAALDAEEVLLSKATIHAPIQGIVLSRNVEPGQTVAASFQTPVLFTLAENLGQMELHVNVDEADVGQIQEGQRATFTVDAYPDRRFPASITEVHFASLTVAGVVTYETVLSVDNSELLLRPGMTATADIVVEQVDDVTLVPNAALRFSPPVAAAAPQAGQQSLLGRLFPRPPRGSTQNNRESGEDQSQQRVWILRDGQPAAIPLITGATDGISSEVVGGGIEPGAVVLVDTLGSGA
jgi:HlyD family secretion protein